MFVVLRCCVGQNFIYLYSSGVKLFYGYVHKIHRKRPLKMVARAELNKSNFFFSLDFGRVPSQKQRRWNHQIAERKEARRGAAN